MHGTPASNDNVTREPQAQSITSTLHRCPLFQQSGLLDVSLIAGISVRKNLAPDEYLYKEGMPSHGFYVVCSGAIKVHRINVQGREQVFHICRPVESFGEEALISEGGCATDACAIENSQVLLIQRAGLMALLKRQPDLAFCLLRSMSLRFNKLVGLIDDLTLKDVKTRFAHWLLQNCPNPDSMQPVSFRLPLAKGILAGELGIASETFSRTLAAFRAQSLLKVQGPMVTVLCPAKLARMFSGKLPTAPALAGMACPRRVAA